MDTCNSTTLAEGTNRQTMTTLAFQMISQVPPQGGNLTVIVSEVNVLSPGANGDAVVSILNKVILDEEILASSRKA